MTHAVSAGRIGMILGAFLYIALGLWVLTLTPRRRQTKLLGAFAIVFGLWWATIRVGLSFHLLDPARLGRLFVELPFTVLSHSLALALAWSVPKPLEDRRPLGIALAVGLGLGLVHGGSLLFAGISLRPTRWGAAVFFATFGIGWAAVVLLALRARPSREPDPSAVTQLALLAVALVMIGSFINGGLIGSTAAALALDYPFLVLHFFSGVVPYLVVAGLWGSHMIQADDETVRIHRAAMLGILGLLAGGAVYFAALPDANLLENPMIGVLQTLGVGLLAYGILRHDIAGLDAKVEFGLSKTTVAGIFVAVFFGASEAAQVLFADFAGNELIGVAAAALLVFAISPLQRLADRFAAKAVPGGAKAGAEAGADAEERFRDLVEATLADGGITPDEERHLLEKADELGIPAARAYDLRRELEEQTEGGEPA